MLFTPNHSDQLKLWRVSRDPQSPSDSSSPHHLSFLHSFTVKGDQVRRQYRPFGFKCLLKPVNRREFTFVFEKKRRAEKTELELPWPKGYREAIRRMTQICRKILHLDLQLQWNIFHRVTFFRRFFRFVWDRVLSFYPRKPFRYRELQSNVSSISPAEIENGLTSGDATSTSRDFDMDSESVTLKISLLGDCDIGKTSFVIKYVGEEQEQSCLQMSGLNLMDKVFLVKGVKIAFSIWDVGGDYASLNHVPIACKDAAAILIMFDLTSRCTLNSVVGWYHQARKWNQTAIPILIGTKFDDFVRLPLDMQWAIVTQAREYAQAMKATLFFSSATHNINVNKIFKFITAKLFNLPWTVERNLKIGEPIIDF
ncbi:septum-promoting GTP-binding protein 1-like [Macadamia integrifolia]|uniref:septum-promoting GTP-binding protein 1-like n=1 Tax=Macadamia integrifolia TaxID=60698 RepID=UPI001C4F8830|nr:septum-promoting GTP-binding protein 1-like [Macadamia integrifolia]